jgi:hypothetical protein
MQIGAVDMDFDYAAYFGCRPSTGYERLLYDSMCDDATMFQRADMVEAGWKVVSPIQDVWRALPAGAFPNYAAGTWGPKEARDLLTRDDRERKGSALALPDRDGDGVQLIVVGGGFAGMRVKRVNRLQGEGGSSWLK